MNYPEAIAISVGIITLGAGGANAIKSLYGKKPCNLHGPLMSDIVSIKLAVMKICAYVADESTKEGRDLDKEIMESMMKHKEK